MRCFVRTVAGGLGIALLLLGTPDDAFAQTRLTVSAGPSEYDLSGTGWSGIGGVRIERELTSWLAWEAGSGLFFYETQGGTDVTMLLPEAGLRFSVRGRVPLYFAAGAGHTLVVKSDHPQEPTLYGALGLSIDLKNGWLLRPEARLHIVDPWVGGIGGYTLGFSKSLGG